MFLGVLRVFARESLLSHSRMMKDRGYPTRRSCVLPDFLVLCEAFEHPKALPIIRVSRRRRPTWKRRLDACRSPFVFVPPPQSLHQTIARSKGLSCKAAKDAKKPKAAELEQGCHPHAPRNRRAQAFLPEFSAFFAAWRENRLALRSVDEGSRSRRSPAEIRCIPQTTVGD